MIKGRSFSICLFFISRITHPLSWFVYLRIVWKKKITKSYSILVQISFIMNNCLWIKFVWQKIKHEISILFFSLMYLYILWSRIYDTDWDTRKFCIRRPSRQILDFSGLFLLYVQCQVLISALHSKKSKGVHFELI